MKFIWEEKDIEPGWRVLSSSAETECILGYRYDNEARERVPTIMTLVSLEDGLELASFSTIVIDDGSRELSSEPIFNTGAVQMAEHLNKHGYKPKTISRFG